ncbi:MAG: translation initiation factor 1A [Candidatus Bathyarchaeota archaeon]|nr:translation initiation factor 1A [Candidatus Bathyarchaeota archaeon]
MGKKETLSAAALSNVVLPAPGDGLCVAVQLPGFDCVLVKPQDGNERLCRIRGKMKRRVWISQGGMVLVSPWDSQSDKRGDVSWRHTRAQAEMLRTNGLISA